MVVMELGISTFVETSPDVHTGKVISHAERLREVVEEIVLAEKVGLDVYGVGEHHRTDYAASSPAVVLSAAASQTKRIRLTSAVTVLSSADPVRVFQDFATLDGISNGRAEIMAGRGSFIQSFPLFGYSLDDYEIAAEKFFPSTQAVMNVLGKERGWPPYGRVTFDTGRSPQGALYVGSPRTVADKIIALHKQVGMTRFLLHMPLGSMPHDEVMCAIELYGTEVAPIVRKEIAEWEAAGRPMP